jgi:hypothetical protein
MRTIDFRRCSLFALGLDPLPECLSMKGHDLPAQIVSSNLLASTCFGRSTVNRHSALSVVAMPLNPLDTAPEAKL